MIREVLKVKPNLCVYLLSLRIIKASRFSANFQDVERLGDMDIDLLSGVALARLAKYQFNISFRWTTLWRTPPASCPPPTLTPRPTTRPACSWTPWGR